MSLRKQKTPAAFEIRFSKTEAQLEVFEIQPSDYDPQERVPDPFKKRDKIPRSSMSTEQFNNTPPKSPRHHGDNPLKKGLSSNSDQVSTLKAKSSNAIVPEGDKRGLRPNSPGNILNDSSINNDETIIRNPNKKQKSLKLDDITNEKSNLGKVIPNNNHQIMDLNGKSDMAISTKKITSKSTTIKNNKLIHKESDENKPLPKDGIATPPDTPPRSPPLLPNSQKNQKISSSSDNGISFVKVKNSQLDTPPNSSDSTNFDDEISTVKPSSSKVSQPKVSQQSRKRKESQSSQSSTLSIKRSMELNDIDQPPKKLTTPRSRRSSSVSGQNNYYNNYNAKISQESINKQSQPRSRIPRLSTSSRERPIIEKKASQGSVSSNNSTIENQSPRGLRSATSRPIINTSFSPTFNNEETESPTNLSPINHSPINQSSNDNSNNNSPIFHSPPRKIISHDDVVIPTIAKKLKMNGQLPLRNHDALLGYSDEPENIYPTTENGYMDITDQVVDLFDSPKNKNKSSKRQSTVPGTQNRRRQRRNSTGHSRNSSKTYYIAPRKQLQDPPSPTSTQLENPPTLVEHSAPHDNDLKRRGKSRREEYIITIIRDDEDEEEAGVVDYTGVVENPPEPTVQVETPEQTYQEKEYIEPVTVQIPDVQEPEKTEKTEIHVETPITTSGKKKKDKKKKQKNSDDDTALTKKSKCLCVIQ